MERTPGSKRRLTPTAVGLFAVVTLVLLAALSTYRRWEGTAPQIRLVSPSKKAAGTKVTIEVEASDPGSGIRELSVTLHQGTRTIALEGQPPPSLPVWRIWSVGPQRWTAKYPDLDLSAQGLVEGPFQMVVEARDRSLRGNQARLVQEMVLDLTAPALAVISGQHYINQGGSELILLRVSKDTAESGVQVGPYFFPACADQLSDPALRIVLIAFPYDLDPGAPLAAIARDEAGNEGRAGFQYKVFPKHFRASQIELGDGFLAAKVPEILSHSPELKSRGDLLQSYLAINGELRQINNAKIAEVSSRDSSEWQWREPFLQLSNSQVESGFADHRTYLYQGRKVDLQDHLGFDLAVGNTTRSRAPMTAWWCMPIG